MSVRSRMTSSHHSALSAAEHRIAAPASDKSGEREESL